MVIDHYGLLPVPIQHVTIPRLIGVELLLISVISCKNFKGCDEVETCKCILWF
ncbi:hypothetical protein ACFPRB_05805 [Metabacillus niabensis]|uniref:hypothetical protein n=1 Tax=Metabacillus niabensis TaxID=324854 RepID=UPI00352209DD